MPGVVCPSPTLADAALPRAEPFSYAQACPHTQEMKEA